MAALKIALETVLVGALALPWLAVAVQLFFPAAKDALSHLSWFGGDQIRSAVGGVLLAAMVYLLGAAVSRLAGDFFNDEDLPLLHPPTENEIRGSVYCPKSYPWIIGDPGVSPQDNAGRPLPITTWCDKLSLPSNSERDFARDQIQQIFHLQESKLLLAGEDKTSRLGLLHQQIMVLRGAAFDGLIVCLLCLLGWNARKQSWGGWRWILPIGLVLYVLYALVCNHLQLCQYSSLHFRSEFADPPFMELTLLLLGAGGCYLVEKGAKGSWPQGTGLASLVLTALAYCGWYWTEILYDRLVIYSFHAGQNLRQLQ